MNVWLRLMVLSARRKKKKNLLTAPHCGRSLFHERDEIFMTIEAQSEACEMREKDKHKQARDRIGINWLCIYRMMLTCPCWCATRSDICLTRSAFELSKVFLKISKRAVNRTLMMEWKLMIFIAADTQKAAKMFLLATSWPHQSATSCWVWFSFFGKFTSQLYLPDIPLSVLCQKSFISLSLYMGQKLLKAALVRHQKLRKSYVIIHNFLPRRRVKVQRKRRGALDNANLYSMIKVKRLHFPTELPSMQLFSSTTATNIFSPSLASASHSTLTNVFRHHRCEFLLYSTRLNSTKKFFFFLLSYFKWRKNTQTRIHHSNTERRTEQKLVIPFRNLMWKICFNFMTVSLSAYTTVGWPERNCWSKVRNFPKESRCHVASIRWSAQPGSLNTFSLYFRSFPSSQAFKNRKFAFETRWVSDSAFDCDIRWEPLRLVDRLKTRGQWRGNWIVQTFKSFFSLLCTSLRCSIIPSASANRERTTWFHPPKRKKTT